MIALLFLTLVLASKALSEIDKCELHYINNVQFIQNKNGENVDFSDYLEYWFNGRESKQQLLERVCKFIYKRFTKKNLRQGRY